MIDTHAHLDACGADADELLARARSAGVSRVVTIGTGIDSCRRAVAIAGAHDGVVAALGIDPHQAATPEAGRIDELRALLTAAARRRRRRDGARRAPRRRHAARAARPPRRAPGACRGARATRRHPQPRRERGDGRGARSLPGTVVLHCFSEPELLEPALQRQYYVSFAGNVTYPNADALRAAATQVPADRILAETDSPYLVPATRPRPTQRTRPRDATPLPPSLRRATKERRELGMRIDENADHAFGLRHL